MAITLRRFDFADYTSALALWQATPGVGLSDADESQPIRHFLDRNPNLSFVATDGAQIVGTVLCGHDGRRGHIHHLVVAESHRRQGLGRRLLQASLSGLDRAGIQKCYLLVFANNKDGLSFWHSVGATDRQELALLSISTRGVT